MMQIKPYKPQKIDNMTKASDLEKPKRTLDDYARVAGIRPKPNPLEPYAKLWREQQAGGTVGTTPGAVTPKPANYVGNAKPQTTAQMAAVSAEGGVPEYTPGSGLSAPKKAVSGSSAGGIRTGGLNSVGSFGSAGSGQSVSPSQTQPKADPWKGYREAYEKSMALKTSPATPAANYGPLQPYAKVAGLVPTSTGEEEMPLRSNNQNWNVNAGNVSSKPASEFPPFSEDSTPEVRNESVPQENSDQIQWERDLSAIDDKWGGDFSAINRDDLDEDERALYDIDKASYDSITYAQRKAQEAIAEAERQKKIQLQQAFINSELTKKNLPIYLKQAGMGGLGVSQSTLAQLANDYQNTVSSVNSEIASAKRGTLDSYKDDIFNVTQRWNTDRNALEGQQAELKKKEELDYLDYMFGLYDPSTAKNVEQLDDLREVFEANKNEMNASQRAEYEKRLNDWQSKLYSKTYIDLERQLRSTLQSAQAMLSPGMKGRPYNSINSQEDIDRIFQNAALQLSESFKRGEISEAQYKELLRRYVDQLGQLKY